MDYDEWLDKKGDLLGKVRTVGKTPPWRSVFVAVINTGMVGNRVRDNRDFCFPGASPKIGHLG